jgi:hypothetical protein
MTFGEQKAKELQLAYQASGHLVEVREIGPGRYETVRPRIRQVISHHELIQELERLRERDGESR